MRVHGNRIGINFIFILNSRRVEWTYSLWLTKEATFHEYFPVILDKHVMHVYAYAMYINTKTRVPIRVVTLWNMYVYVWIPIQWICIELGRVCLGPTYVNTLINLRYMYMYALQYLSICTIQVTSKMILKYSLRVSNSLQISNFSLRWLPLGITTPTHKYAQQIDRRTVYRKFWNIFSNSVWFPGKPIS